ncbi:hypothetical protein FHS27_001383 [Rhodopirellula rubra]|uniref:Uncharacterized protein n=1 Tax=Aporhodopirellula rubra TaxID=980271 RepID=A0A7W5H4W7_9BACT|nr:hypothetical protein [Aporhodopirellula rubra]
MPRFYKIAEVISEQVLTDIRRSAANSWPNGLLILLSMSRNRKVPGVFTVAQSQRAIVFRFDQAIGLGIAVRFFRVPGNCGNSMVTNDGTSQQVDDFATPPSCFVGVRFRIGISHGQNLEVRNGNMRLTHRSIPRPSKFWI